MTIEKLSVSLPPSLVEFVTVYQHEHNCKSRSEVIKEALLLLRQFQLEQDYRAADKENDDAFEATTFDGLTDETW